MCSGGPAAHLCLAAHMVCALDMQRIVTLVTMEHHIPGHTGNIDSLAHPHSSLLAHRTVTRRGAPNDIPMYEVLEPALQARQSRDVSAQEV